MDLKTARKGKRGRLLLAGVAAMGLATAGAAHAQDRTEIVFSYLWGGAEAEALEAVIADFNASQDEITVQGVSNPDTTRQLVSMSARNGSFDVSGNFGNNMGAWASRGILEPLDQYGIDVSDFAPASLAQVTYDGQIYALPIAVHTYQVIYNKALLEEAGVEPPTTMEELAAAIPALTKFDEDGNMTQLGFGYANLRTLMLSLGFANGGDWYKDGQPTPLEPANLEGVQFYIDNVIDAFGSDVLNRFIAGFGPYMSDQDAFATGKVAMMLDGAWRSAHLSKIEGLDWGAIPLPAFAPEHENTTMVDTSTLFIPANSENKEAAAEFLKYLFSPEPMAKFTAALGNMPARVSLIGSDSYAHLENIEVWQAALASDNAVGAPSVPFTSEYLSDLGSAFEQVLQGNATLEEALGQVADRSENYPR